MQLPTSFFIQIYALSEHDDEPKKLATRVPGMCVVDMAAYMRLLEVKDKVHACHPLFGHSFHRRPPTHQDSLFRRTRSAKRMRRHVEQPSRSEAFLDAPLSTLASQAVHLRHSRTASSLHHSFRTVARFLKRQHKLRRPSLRRLQPTRLRQNSKRKVLSLICGC